MGRLKKGKVVSIDTNKKELQEAPPGPIKIIMDAADLKFLDRTFETAASFFTLMYIPDSIHKRVFRETFRVLKNGGRFLIWDAVFPERPDDAKDIAVFPLTVHVSHNRIDTGYGVPWPKTGRDIRYFEETARQTGFEIHSMEENGMIFTLMLMKPD